MPIWEDYEVTVDITYAIKVRGEVISTGMAPGDGRGTSNREVKGLTMEEALQEAVGQAEDRVRAAVRGTEAARRRELGYKDGD